MHGRAEIGYNSLASFSSTKKLASYRIVNEGTSTATVGLTMDNGGIRYPVTQRSLRLDPGDMVVESDCKLTLIPNSNLVLTTDNTDIFWWVEFA